MRSAIIASNNSFYRILCLVLIITSLISLFFPNVTAMHKEFDVKEFNENVTIPRNDFRAIDFKFQDGKELEVIYTIQESQGQPIDLWFVNEDNYLLLTNGAQFLYLVDGTSKQVSYTKKLVVLTEHDNYKLVMTNYYSNQTVEVDIMGEIRTFKDSSEENSLNFSSILFYALIIIIIILTILLIVLGLKLRKSKQTGIIANENRSTKKAKAGKTKKDKSKDKSNDSIKKTRSKKSKQTKNKDFNKLTSKQSKTKIKSESTNFCGYCGELVDTPYCKYCGRKV